MNGYARINQFDFEVFSESAFLKEQVEEYKKLFGCYLEVVQTDDIYMTRDNRAYLKKWGIRHTGRLPGRKPEKETQTRYQKEKQRREKNERNQIEGKFGQGKAGYNMNKIMARLADTHESWVASIVFIMNILRAMEDIFLQFSKNVFFCSFFYFKHTKIPIAKPCLGFVA